MTRVSVLVVLSACASMCVAACGSFGAASDDPAPPGADAGAGSADAQGSDGASPEGGGPAWACATPTEIPIDFSQWDSHESNGTTMPAARELTTSATGTGKLEAYRSLDLHAASSLAMSFDVELRGIDGLYIEHLCALDVYHHATNSEPVTNVFFTQATSRDVHFKISTAPDSATQLDEVVTSLPVTPGRYHVEIAVASFHPTVTGTVTFGGTTRPFSVPAFDKPARLRLLCGLYYTEPVSPTTVNQKVTGFSASRCP